MDYETAHEIGRQLADAVTKGQHEYVLTTHIDKGHVSITSCDFLRGQFRRPPQVQFQQAQLLRHTEHERQAVPGTRLVCCRSRAEGARERAMQSIRRRKRVPAMERQAENRRGRAHSPSIRVLRNCFQRLQAAGYEIKPGKYVSCRAPGQERFTRLENPRRRLYRGSHQGTDKRQTRPRRESSPRRSGRRQSAH